MSSPAWSAAIAIVSNSTVPFDARYTARSWRPAVAAIELTTAAWGRRTQMGQCRPRETKDFEHVDVEHVVPLVQRLRLDRALGSDADVVEEHVDAAHRHCRLLDCFGDRCVVGDVGMEGNGGGGRTGRIEVRTATVAPRRTAVTATAWPMPDAPPLTNTRRPA
jgi:hypothetical protein